MTKHAIVFLDDGPWRIALSNPAGEDISILSSGDDVLPEKLLDKACECLQQSGHHDSPVVLALPSSWCAAGSVSLDGLPRKDRREALAYRLEEALPVAAEQFSADFIHHKHEALGVCAIREKVGPVVEALVSRGITIHAIVPTAMLIAQACSKIMPGPDADVLIWRHDGWCDTMTLDDKHQRPTSWLMLPDDPASVLLHLDMMSLRGRVVHGLTMIDDRTNPVTDPARYVPARFGLKPLDADPYPLAAGQAAKILDGQVESWIDLKDEALGGAGWLRQIGKPFKAALAASLLLLVCLNAALLWRANQYDTRAAEYRADETAMFQDLHPGQTPPLAVNMRLAGELRKLRGMQGQSDSLPKPPATLTLLHDVLSKLPDAIHLRIHELRIEDDQVYLDMQARSQPDVAAIEKALDGDGLSAKVMHTEQLPDKSGVGFMMVVTADKAPAADPDKKGPGI